MDTLMVLLLVIMFIFILIFLGYLVYFIMKWQRIAREDRKRLNLRGPAERKEGPNVVKIPSPRYKLEIGGSYFLFDKGSDQGYKLVKAYLARGYVADTITHFKPRGLKKRLAPLESEFIWLTREKVEDKEDYGVIIPTNLGFILQELEDRLGGENHIIYFDCLERCYSDNGPDRTNKFLKNLKKLVEKKDGVLLMSIEARGTNRKTRDFLKSNFKQLSGKGKG